MDVFEATKIENGLPEINYPDQGSQHTSPSWTNYLNRKAINTSMDNKGRSTYNIGIKRF